MPSFTPRLLLGSLATLGIILVLMVALGREPARMMREQQSFAGRDIALGAKIYFDNCIDCHGRHGEGLFGPALNATDLLFPALSDSQPPRLRQQQWQGDLHSYLEGVISYGRTGNKMPAWSDKAGGPLRPDQIQTLIAFILNWAQEPAFAPLPAPNLHVRSAGLGYYLFHGPAGCADCHTFDDANGVIGPNLSTVVADGGREAVYNDIVNTNDHLAPGFPPHIMPESYGYVLSENQIRSLIDYLEHPENASLQTAPLAQSERELALWGEQVIQGVGCLGCHTTDGTPSDGPSLAGIYGITRTLADGDTVLVDDDYLYESIIQPSAKRVAGYPDIMDQDYEYRITEEDIQTIIAYIKTLR